MTIGGWDTYITSEMWMAVKVNFQNHLQKVIKDDTERSVTLNKYIFKFHTSKGKSTSLLEWMGYKGMIECWQEWLFLFKCFEHLTKEIKFHKMTQWQGEKNSTHGQDIGKNYGEYEMRWSQLRKSTELKVYYTIAVEIWFLLFLVHSQIIKVIILFHL